MKGFLIKWLINIAALTAVVHIVPGIYVDRWETTIIAALVLGLINAFLRPAVIFITLPLTIFSLGLFTLIINGSLFYLASKIVKGFGIVDFWSAFLGALCFSIISFLLNIFLSPEGKINMRVYGYNPTGQKPRRSDVIDVEAHVEEEDGKK